jgi:hypothetical protein
MNKKINQDRKDLYYKQVSEGKITITQYLQLCRIIAKQEIKSL